MQVVSVNSIEQLIARTSELLWAIANCDVESVDAHRRILLTHLHELEMQAAAMGIHDLYDAVVNSCSPLLGA